MRKSERSFSGTALAAVLFGGLGVPPGSRLKLAYSGGLDSHVLLHALAALRADHSFSLSAIYIDHGLQPASIAWAEHCAKACTQWAVTFESRRIQIGDIGKYGLEAAARHARYRALQAALTSNELLLTAHHRNDQAETVLLQLLRGAGMAGLAGMPARVAFGSGELLRPLLGFTRSALNAYAIEHGLSWIEDPSNRDTRLRRNFLRTEILPRLASQWPQVDGMLARAAQHAAEAVELLDEAAAQDLSMCQQATQYFSYALSVAALLKLSNAHQRNLLRYWIKRQGFLSPAARTLHEVLAQLHTAPRSQHACVRGPDAEIWRYRDQLVAIPLQSELDRELDVLWDLRAPIDLPGIGQLRTEPVHGRGLAVGRLTRGLNIRLRRGGETVLLPGRHHHHALKKLLQEQGVPPWLRARLPLLYADNNLAAVADHWVCAPYAARPDEKGLVIFWSPDKPDSPIATQRNGN